MIRIIALRAKGVVWPVFSLIDCKWPALKASTFRTVAFSTPAVRTSALRASALVAALFVLLLGHGLAAASARAADPAVAFMDKVARELLAAARSKSPELISSVIARYGDTSYIGAYSLGTYRSQLHASDKPTYVSGMTRFIGRYAAQQAPADNTAGKLTRSFTFSPTKADQARRLSLSQPRHARDQPRCLRTPAG